MPTNDGEEAKRRFAQIPFKALSRMHELKPNEQQLFIWLCLHRHESGQCNPGDAMLMDEINISRSPFFEARKGLIKRRWIECDFETRSYKLAFHPEIQDEPPLPKTDETHPEIQDEVAKAIPKSRTDHPEIRDRSSRNSGLHIGRTDHEQTKNKQGNTARAPEYELTPVHQALLRVLGWGLAPPKEKFDRVDLAVTELLELSAGYGENYTPTPERLARFPDYAKASKFSSWTERAIVNHWKRAVDWLNVEGATDGKSTTGRRETRHERSERLLQERDYASYDEPD